MKKKINLIITLILIIVAVTIGVILYENATNIRKIANNKTIVEENTNLKEQTVWNSETQGLDLEVTDADITTKSITVKVVKAEIESASEQDLEYKYYIKESNKVDYEKTARYTGKEKSYTYSNLVAEKNYDVKVVLTNTNTKTDIESEIKVINTKQMPNAQEEITKGTITASEPTWSNEKASVTLSTTTGLEIEYQINTATEGGWTQGTTVSNLKNGDIVRIRLSDGNNTGKIGSITIGEEVQEVNIIKQDSTVKSITVKVTSNNKEYREETRPEYSYYIKEASTANYPSTPTYTGTDSYTFNNLKTDTQYDIKVVLTNKAGNVIQGELKESSTKQDDIAPKVTVTEKAVTTSTIQVSVTTKDDEAGMPESPIYKYYIKKSSDTDYPTEPNYTGTEPNYTFTGLEQNVSYDIKVTTVDNAGNEGEGVLEGITTTLINGGLETGEITVGEVTWSDGKGTVTLETTTDLYIQYKVGKDGTWRIGTEVTNLEHGDIIYVRLTDGNNYGDEGTVTIQDKIAPTVTITKGEVKTNSIQVTVSATDEQNGMPLSPTYKYYIKKITDADYSTTPTYTGTNASYTFTGLEQNVSYDIKVITQDKAGNEGEGKLEGTTTTGITGKLETGEITVGEVTWSDGKGTVTLETTTDLYIQYKVGEDGTWGIGTEVTNLEHGDVVYVRLTDGNNYGDEGSITILDKTVPTVTITKGEVTTNSIQVTVSATDEQAGMPENPTYRYFIKKSSDTDYTTTPTYTGTNTSYTFTGLTQNTSYDIKVTTQDIAGNTGEKTLTGTKTEQITGGLETGEITVSAATWSSGSASITLSTTTSLTIQYKKGSSGTWTTGTKVTGLKHGDVVYVRLTDGNNYGEEGSITILDKTVPTVTVTKGEVTTNSIQVTVSATDEQAGMPTTPTYNYYIKKTSDTDYSTTPTYAGTNVSYTFTELEQNVSYDIKVTTQDIAGNEGEGKLEGTTTTGITGGIETGEITVGEVTWSDGKGTVTLETTTDLYIQYKVGKDGTWKIGTEVTNLEHGDIIYVRLTDGNNYGSEGSVTIQDKAAPTVSITKGTVTTNSIKITASATDAQSGMPTTPTYKYYIKLSSTTTWPSAASYSGTNTSYTFTGLTQNTSYDVKVTTQDIAGNTGVKTLTGTKTTQITGGLETGEITVSAATWSSGSASITLSTTTSLTIQYKKGSSGTWTTGTKVTGLKHGDVVYVRLTDGNNYGSEATVNILDGTKPTASISLSTTSTKTGQAITATVTHTDSQSGVNTSSCKYVYNTTSSKLGTTSTTWNTATAFSSRTQTISLTASTAGTYYLHVLTVDVAGNKTETVSQAVTVEKATIKAPDIANATDKSLYYGKIVTNYDCTNRAGVNAWKIFYADSNNIYLITDDYIPYDYMPYSTTSSGVSTTNKPEQPTVATNYPRTAAFENVIDDYSTGSARVTNSTIRNLNKKYFDYLRANNANSTNNTMKATAYMLDTNAWSGFKGEKADYAIGGATIEMLFTSYNQTHSTNYQTRVQSTTGYQISKDGGTNWAVEYSGMINTNDAIYGTLYVIPSNTNAPGAYLASPRSGSEWSVPMIVSYSGSIIGDGFLIDTFGFRPLVCLNTSVQLEKLADGNYKIK